MAKLFQVLYDGASRPIIQTPSGRFLSLSEFQLGRWVSYDNEDRDCKVITEVLNWVLVNSPEIIQEWECGE